MRYILSSRSRHALRKFAAGNVLVALDFDGTVAPIISDPDLAAIPPATRDLLRNLASCYRCIVVSGRSRADVRKRVRGIQFDEIIGNHGIEPWNTSLGVARVVDAWIPILRLGLRNFAKLVLENKTFSVSIHFRGVRDKKKARRAIVKLARTLPNARLVGGKQVVNIVPFGAPNKGFAVEQARRRLGCDKVIYVGDDETDEDAFLLARGRRFLAVRVGANRSSLARFYLRNQREIDLFLRILVACRKVAPSG